MRRNGRVIPHYFGRLFMVRPHGDSYGVFRRRGNRKHSGRRIRRTRLPRARRRRVGVKRGSGRTGLGSCWFTRNFDMAPYVFVSACCGNCGNVHGRYVARAARHRFKAHVGGQSRARNGWGLTLVQPDRGIRPAVKPTLSGRGRLTQSLGKGVFENGSGDSIGWITNQIIQPMRWLSFYLRATA